MVIIRTTEYRGVPGVKDLLDIKIKVDFLDTRPDVAMNEIFSALEEVAKTLIEEHKPDCDCLVLKFAKKIERHIAEIHDEMRTEVGARQ